MVLWLIICKASSKTCFDRQLLHVATHNPGTRHILYNCIVILLPRLEKKIYTDCTNVPAPSSKSRWIFQKWFPCLYCKVSSNTPNVSYIQPVFVSTHLLCLRVPVDNRQPHWTNWNLWFSLSHCELCEWIVCLAQTLTIYYKTFSVCGGKKGRMWKFHILFPSPTGQSKKKKIWNFSSPW